MDLGLEGKAALVTGSSRGIGKATALVLAEQGCAITLCARGKETLENAEKEIAAVGAEVLAVPGDVTKPDDVSFIVGQAQKAFGRLDILVNTIGSSLLRGRFLDLTDTDWQTVLELNLYTPVRFCRAVIPIMRKQGDGRIVNVSTGWAREPGPSIPHYNAAKTGVLSLTKNLANEFAQENIRVNAVCPGPVFTSSWKRRAERRAKEEGIKVQQALESIREEERREVPMGRVGEPEEIASLIAFLVSDRASFITGSCYVIDGGCLRSIF